MSLVKELRKALIENSLSKGEDPEAYKKLAQTGFILAHPVKIGGKDKRPDNGIDYHSTIKFFDKESDNPEHAHETASKLEHQHIDPKKVDIKPKVLKDRNGNDVYAIGLHGHHANKIKEHHDKFSHFGNKENYEWGAHISVPKAVHDEIKAKSHKTAHEAGIEFGPAELRRGPKTLQTYHPKMKKSEELEIKHPSDLNLDKGDKDISEKSLADIQRETAWTWASRAAACYEKLAKTGDWKWKTDAEEYRHEAVEHAALIGDSHPHVLEEIHKSLEKYRNTSQKEAEGLEKVEPLLKPWSSQAQAAWGHSPEGKKALGGETAVKEWDNATKGKHLPKHVAKTEDLEKGLMGDWSKDPSYKTHWHEEKTASGRPLVHATVTHNSVGHNDPKNKHVARVTFFEPKENNPNKHWEPISHVDEKHRRKGITSTLYSQFKTKYNKTIAPNPKNQSEDAKALWSSGKPNLNKSEKSNLVPPPSKDTYKELTLHHGTKSATPFEHFNMKHHQSGFYPGVYTSSDPEHAKQFGNPVKVGFKGHLFEIKDPKHAEQLQSHVGGGASGHKLVEHLKNAGYHGIKRGSEHIIFNPEHAKIEKSESLEKGAVKNALTAGMMATALASPQHIEAKTHSPGALHPQVSASPNTGYDRQKMLNALSQVESSGGKNTHHKPTSMGTAYGRFAEMPDVIHDTIRLNPDLKRKHGKALRLQGDNLNRYMQDNKGLEDLIAQKHLERLEHHFGNNPEAIAYAYNHGIIGTNRALKAKQNISEHPYVKKFKQYYGGDK